MSSPTTSTEPTKQTRSLSSCRPKEVQSSQSLHNGQETRKPQPDDTHQKNSLGGKNPFSAPPPAPPRYGLWGCWSCLVWLFIASVCSEYGVGNHYHCSKYFTHWLRLKTSLSVCHFYGPVQSNRTIDTRRGVLRSYWHWSQSKLLILILDSVGFTRPGTPLMVHSTPMRNLGLNQKRISTFWVYITMLF